jgi:hypothetical protein
MGKPYVVISIEMGKLGSLGKFHWKTLWDYFNRNGKNKEHIAVPVGNNLGSVK